VTGIVRWHVLSQHESLVGSPDAGKLLVLKQEVIWQEAGTVYVLHIADGQVAWQRFIRDDNLYPLPQSQTHIAETAGVLLVQRSYTYHALDLATGQELWRISDIATDSPAFSGGVVVAGNMFLIYGGGILEAVRASDRQVLWSQKQLGTIQGLKISDDGSLVYIVVVNSIDEGAPTQALAALSTKSGTVLWTFEPFEQESFVHTQTDGFQYARNILFVSLCLPESQVQCHRERLYALNGANGEILWRVEASRIYDVRSSADGSAVLLQSNTSEWINLAGYFRS
jgi:outer membrane protein assembly factor BamB